MTMSGETAGSSEDGDGAACTENAQTGFNRSLPRNDELLRAVTVSFPRRGSLFLHYEFSSILQEILDSTVWRSDLPLQLQAGSVLSGVAPKARP